MLIYLSAVVVLFARFIKNMTSRIKRIKKAIQHVVQSLAANVICTIKRTIKSIYRILYIVFACAFVVFPFLHRFVSPNLILWLWIPSCVLFVIFCAFSYPELSNPLFNFLGGWGIVASVPLFASILVFNYFNIDYIWHWVLFFIIAIFIVVFLLSLLLFDWKEHQRSEDEKKAGTKNIVRIIALYILFDLLYLSIFNDWFCLKYFFGGIAVFIIFSNLVDAFLHGIKTARLFFVLDLVLGLLISGYLIYIIPDIDLRNIVLSIASALIGGIFTLLGVAWTFKKSDADRLEDLRRIEEERKDDERKRNIPYIKLSCENHTSMCSCTFKSFGAKEFVEKGILDEGYFVFPKAMSIKIKNISNCNIIIEEMQYEDFHIVPSGDCIIGAGETHLIYIEGNREMILNHTIKEISLIVRDMLENAYRIQLFFTCTHEPTSINAQIDGKLYPFYDTLFEARSVSLPKYFDVKK